ncbi:MAG: Ig-like domain-containing protein [Caldilineaceae bacterium]
MTVTIKRTRDLAACRNGNLTGPTQAANDTATVVTNEPTKLSVLANDQGDNLLITAVGDPQHGVVSHTDRTITYTSPPGFSGTDTFTYTVDSAVAANLAPGAAHNVPVIGVVTVTVAAAPPASMIYLPLIAR